MKIVKIVPRASPLGAHRKLVARKKTPKNFQLSVPFVWPQNFAGQALLQRDAMTTSHHIVVLTFLLVFHACGPRRPSPVAVRLLLNSQHVALKDLLVDLHKVKPGRRMSVASFRSSHPKRFESQSFADDKVSTGRHSTKIGLPNDMCQFYLPVLS